jgi:alkanesulfonate monooxygenase SsuD/methylene tetrahydromethanopterin reductase-like flavin-dependent oxidoreductase (luciferase family)
MKFALFYEIPVAQPWGERSEYDAIQNTVTQAVAGDRFGWDAFWTVEHHFLEEYSICSNPEVLYGAIAAQTENIRLGYGVRLMPKPYNHPIRTAESVATLDLLSNGRVDFGTGRSATRLELEGFGIDPAETREMWREAIGHVVNAWTNERNQFDGKHWQMPERRIQPKPFQKPHPPIFGATTSDEGHEEVGSLGLGLCSFAVGVPPDEIGRKISIYRDAVKKCTTPLGAFVNNQASTFTMMNVAPTEEEARAVATESFEWYPKAGARMIGKLAEWMEERKQGLGNYHYAADMNAHDKDGSLDLLTMDILMGMNAAVCGTPDQAVEMCRRYEAAGVDLLLCLVNPYKIPHDKVMQTIELMGKHVIPEFKK